MDSDESLSLIEDETLDVIESDFVYYGLEPHTDNNSIFGKKPNASIKSSQKKSQSSKNKAGPLFDYAKIHKIKPDLDLNDDSGHEFSAIALWTQENVPAERNGLIDGGFSSCRPFYAVNIL